MTTTTRPATKEYRLSVRKCCVTRNPCEPPVAGALCVAGSCACPQAQVCLPLDSVANVHLLAHVLAACGDLGIVVEFVSEDEDERLAFALLFHGWHTGHSYTESVAWVNASEAASSGKAWQAVKRYLWP